MRVCAWAVILTACAGSHRGPVRTAAEPEASGLGGSRGQQDGPPLPPSPPQWVGTLGSDHPLLGVAARTSDGARVSLPEMAMRLGAYRAILVGEQHDNRDHHRLQAWLVRYLASLGTPIAVAFEMLDVDDQAKIDRALSQPNVDAAGLAETVAWSASGWPDFSLYAPVFEAALRADAPLLASGLPRAQAMQVARGQAGKRFDDIRARYGLDEPLSEELGSALAQEMQAAHCGHMPERMLPSMIAVQRLRDGLLAEGVRSGLVGTQRVVLVAGNGHVRKDRGVPSLLSKVGVQGVSVVGLLEVDPERRALADYVADHGSAFDYIVLTPRASDRDHCAELLKRLSPDHS